MFSKIKFQIKLYSKKILNIMIALQLCLIQPYSYTANTANSSQNLAPLKNQKIISVLNQALKKFADQQKGQLSESALEMIKLGELIESGEYPDKPSSIPKKDYFLLTNQTVKLYEHYHNTEKNEIEEKVVQTINLNEFATRPIPALFKEVHARYNAETRSLVLEGVSANEVILRQNIPDLDIVDYIQDKEFLLLLDKNKGLLLVDMFFPRTYLGNAPVPVFSIPTYILEHLQKTTGKTIANLAPGSIAMEFIHRGIQPLDVMPDYITNIEKNLEKNSLFSAGDFMLSYTDRNGKKHLVQLLKRQEIAGWAKTYYNIIDMMIKVVAPQLLKGKDFESLIQQIQQATKQNPELSAKIVLSSLFTKNSMNKLSKAGEIITARAKQLKDIPERDKFLLKEWRESFQKVKENIEKANKVTGAIPNTKKIIEYYSKKTVKEITKKEKKIRASALRIMAGILQKSSNFVKQHSVTITTAGTITAAGFLYPEAFIRTINNIFPFINNMQYSGSFAYYQITSIPNFVLLFGFIPGIVILTSLLYIPFLKQFKKILPKTLFSFYPKGSVEDHITKWENISFAKKIVGVGIKFMAYAIYPFWNYIANLVGQPHFITAIQKGLNPFKKIQPNSDIGTLSNLSKAARLGTQGPMPQWERTQAKDFNQHRKLQNAALVKKQRIESITWLMASLAVSGKTGVNPVEILIYGATAINLDEIQKIHNDTALKAEVIWVMRHLGKEIHALDELDIRNQLAEIDPKILIKYYERAKKLAEEVKKHHPFRNKIRNIFNSESFFHFFQKITGTNKTQHELLKNIPSDFITGRVGLEFTTDHFMTAVIPLVTTDRAEFLFEHFSQLAVNENASFFSGKAHLKELWLNAISHLFISGAMQTMTFTKPSSNIAQFHQDFYHGNPNINKEPQYAKEEKYTKEIKTKQQTESNMYKHQIAYLFSGGKENNLGDVMWNMYVSRLRIIQMTILLFVGIRLLVTPQPFIDAVAGFILYHLAGQWIFGWPWDIIHGAAKVSESLINTNKQKMEDLKIKLSQIERGLQSDKEELKTEYQTAVKQMAELYNTSKTLKKKLLDTVSHNSTLYNYLKTANGKIKMKDIPVPTDTSHIKNISQKLIYLLRNHPPLFNKKNKWGNITVSSLLGGVLTTYLFIKLSIMTFSSDYLTAQNILKWAGINYTLYGLFYFLYKKGIKGHWASLKNTKRQIDSIEDMKRHFESMKSWSSYYSDGFLNLSSDIKNSVKDSCRKIFLK